MKVANQEVGGSGSLVLFGGGLLLIIAGWNTIVYPILNSGWNGVPLGVTPSSFQKILGGVVFLIILLTIASTGDAGEEFAMFTVVALWLVFLIMNGTGFLSGVFNFLGGGGTTQTPPADGSTQNTKKGS